jgi:hypothetical protein
VSPSALVTRHLTRSPPLSMITDSTAVARDGVAHPMRADASAQPARSLDTDAAPARLAAVLAAIAIAVAWTWLVFQPLRDVPFPIIDFSEFLPLLERGSGFADRFLAVTHYYRGHGRLNLIPNAMLVVNWMLFGDWAVGWQLLRAAIMLACAAVTYVVLRRFAMTRLASVVGAIFAIAGGAATAAWLRPTGEPIAYMLVAAGAALGVGFQTTPRWGRRVVAIAAVSILALYTKEVVVAALPFVFIVALTSHSAREWRLPRVTRRNVALVFGAGGAAVLSALPILYVAWSVRGRTSQAYAAMYGLWNVQPLPMLVRFIKMWVPFPFGAPTRSSSQLPVGVGLAIAFAAVLVGGVAVWARRRTERSRFVAIVGLSLLVTLGGVVVYAPWGNYEYFYGLPYVFGTILLLAGAISAIQRYASRAVVPAVATLAVIGLACSVHSARFTRFTAINQEVEATLARSLAQRAARADSLIFGVSWVINWDWLGPGAALRRYMAVRDHMQPPPARSRLCDEVARRLAGGPTRDTYVVYSEYCPRLHPARAEVIRGAYSFLDWNLRPVVDTMRVEVVYDVSDPGRQK